MSETVLHRPLVAALAATALVFVHPSAGQSPADSTAGLTGRVLSGEDGSPIVSAFVELQRSGANAVTDSAGRFRIPSTSPGLDIVRVSLIGFAESAAPVQLRTGHTTSVTFHLDPEVLRMDDIEITVKSGWRLARNGFWHRERRGLGIYFTPEEIEETRASRPSDLLRSLAGIYVAPSQAGISYVAFRRTPRNSGCRPAVFVDGQEALHMAVDEIAMGDVLAMEVYRGTSDLPAQFHRTVGRECGAIIVWTRLRDSS